MAPMSHRSDLQQGLASVGLFSSCSKRDLAIVARHAETATVPAGTKLTEEGAPGDAFFFILDGQATVLRSGRPVARLGPGDFFGELALLDPAPRNATVVADTDVTVGVLGARVFRAILRDVPAMTEKLLRGLARRIRDLDAKDH